MSIRHAAARHPRGDGIGPPPERGTTTMQVMLLIHADDSQWNAMPDAAKQEAMAAYRAYADALVQAGAMRGGERLRPATEALTVRLRDGAPQVLDGPYAETKEQLGGYFLIEVADMQEAARWAARCPGAAHGTMEVRPIWSMG
jgi:hypothetical protein